MAEKKKFYRIPQEVSKMTDAEIDVWATSAYQDFVGIDIKCFPIAKERRAKKKTTEKEMKGGEE